MITFNKAFFLVLSTLTLNSSADKSSYKFKDVYWVCGTWEMKTSKGSVFESWVKLSDEELAGKSYTINGSDTTVHETIGLVNERDSVFYIPTVKKQNQGLPVRFKAVLIEEDQFRVENKAHDFPQTITYKKITNDSLLVELTGEVKGKSASRKFPMKKTE